MTLSDIGGKWRKQNYKLSSGMLHACLTYYVANFVDIGNEYAKRRNTQSSILSRVEIKPDPVFHHSFIDLLRILLQLKQWKRNYGIIHNDDIRCNQ